MIRFLVGIGTLGVLALPFASGGDIITPPVAVAAYAHPITVRGLRVSPVRVQPVHIQFGHIESDTLADDTEI